MGLYSLLFEGHTAHFRKVVLDFISSVTYRSQPLYIRSEKKTVYSTYQSWVSFVPFYQNRPTRDCQCSFGRKKTAANAKGVKRLKGKSLVTNRTT